MKSFVGFPPGKTRFTPIPDLFFTELLAIIDDLAELKLTLFMFWSLNRQRGYPRYMTRAELEAEGVLLSALQPEGPADPQAALHAAIERAVTRGTLLQLSIDNGTEQADYFFLNTPQGRKAVEQVKSGEMLLETAGHVREAHVEQPRPNIFQLYEQNVGLLQPLLAEELAEAERTYPPEWIEEAFQIAVEANARSWRYIKAILERWEERGKDESGRAKARGRAAHYMVRNQKS